MFTSEMKNTIGQRRLLILLILLSVSIVVGVPTYFAETELGEYCQVVFTIVVCVASLSWLVFITLISASKPLVRLITLAQCSDEPHEIKINLNDMSEYIIQYRFRHLIGYMYLKYFLIILMVFFAYHMVFEGLAVLLLAAFASEEFLKKVIYLETLKIYPKISAFGYHTSPDWQFLESYVEADCAPECVRPSFWRGFILS